MKTIKLTRGQVAVVDDKDFALVSQFKWHAAPGGRQCRNKFYAATNVRKEGGQRVLFMHWLILGEANRVKGAIGDHKNGDSLNNSRKNLRIVTSSQNNSNRKPVLTPKPNNTVGVRGVSRQGDRFRAGITIRGERILLGVFKTAELAGKAYRRAQLEAYEKAQLAAHKEKLR